jgi:hypothetical protein
VREGSVGKPVTRCEGYLIGLVLDGNKYHLRLEDYLSRSLEAHISRVTGDPEVISRTA